MTFHAEAPQLAVFSTLDSHIYLFLFSTEQLLTPFRLKNNQIEFWCLFDCF